MFCLLQRPLALALAAAAGFMLIFGMVLFVTVEVITLPQAVAVAAGVLYVFFLQYKAGIKQQQLQRCLKQQKMLRDISCGLFDNVLEADITANRLIGDNAPHLARLLGIGSSDNYEQLIIAIIERLVKEDFREEYRDKFSRQSIMQLYALGIDRFEYELVEKSDGINFRWVKVFVRIYRDEDSNTIRIISHVKNIQREKERELAILHQAQRDSLTSLYNRAVTKELIEMALSAGPEGQGYALFIIDIDNFKAVNDTFGHAFGDLVISTMANELRNHFGPKDVVGRIGGDEFLIFMQNSSGREAAAQKADALCRSVPGWIERLGPRPDTSLSIGICSLPEDGWSFAEIYEKADQALYRAKKRGKNTFSFYDELEQA